MSLGFEARGWLRAAREGSLATAGPDGPHAALVTPATTPALDVLLLLSDLSRHTRALLAEPRCALLVTGPTDGPNPQMRPRLTVSGRAAPIAAGDFEAAARGRFLSIHPYAALYAGLGGFRLFRFEIDDALLVAGFGRAHRIGREALLPPAPTWDETAMLDAARAAWPGRMPVAADADGVDVASGEATLRRAFAAPAPDARAFAAALRTA